ncbi:MAG: sugar phosphate isomerase/epimerase [Clostridia bacterium]|nr:sugar phosphate isomerase/epimerase [Clostridia bacterium]
MKLAIWSNYYYELSPEDAVREFIKNGIYASELADEHGAMLLERGDDVRATGRAFAEFLKENDFDMTQGHLWLYAKICTEQGAIEKLYKWIDLYEAIGIRNMVLHCDVLAFDESRYEECAAKNIEKLKIVAEYIKDKDITICLENLGPQYVITNVDRINYIIDQVGSDKLGICLDTGHLHLNGKSQREYILKAGKRLRAIHIADNEGKWDQHLMPFSGGHINFSEVVSALREIGYDGLFNLEIPGESRIPLELRNAKLAYIQSCYNYLMR